MSNANSGEAPVSTPRSRTRRADRRHGLSEILAYLADGLECSNGGRDLRERFESSLRVLLGTDGIWIRDEGVAPAAEAGDALSIEIPGTRPVRARLEASFGGRVLPDEWERQLLEAASSLAALVLASERSARTEIVRASAPPNRANGTTMLLGSSDAINAVRERVERVAATDFTILIEGESGTGKELVARQIHELSRRRRGPFVAVNCAALVETLLEAELFGIEERTATGVRGRRGKFEHADQGTLFLDEVSDLSISAQAKLLRAIQDMSVERVGGQVVRRVDTRIVVATNRNLHEMVERGRFRVDLFYRLNGVEVVVPPLRHRRHDVPELACAFLDRHRHVRPLTLSRTALEALVAYDWPGNVRELERVVERAVAIGVGEEIGLDDLPPAVAGDLADALMPSAERNDTLKAWASRYVRLVLERHGGNRRKACEALGISYHTLRAHLRRGAASSGHASSRPVVALQS